MSDPACLAARALSPLSHDDPCGPDPKRLDTFVELRQEVGRDTGLSQASTDWSRVQTLALNLLETKSKDLRCASYLGMAWVHLAGVIGLNTALHLFVSLLQDYPETLHPRARRGRMVGRERTLAWFGENVTRWLQGQSNLSIEFDLQTSINDNLKQLQACCHPLVLPELAALSGLIKRLSSKIIQTPKPAPSISRAPASQPPRESSRSEAVAPLSVAPLSLSEIMDAQRRQALTLLQEDFRSPLAYRCLRQSLWGRIESVTQLPNGRTSIQGLSPQARAKLEEHASHARWPGLLEYAEDLFTRYPLSLDLQRYSAQALDGLGNSQAAIRSILAELSALLFRFPNLRSFCDQRGTPLADHTTCQWLGQKLSLIAPKPTPTPRVDDEDESWSKDLSTIEPQDEAALIAAIQRALDRSPDQLRFSQRSIHLAQRHAHLPGLTLLLSTLAHDALQQPSSRVMHKELESATLNSLLQAQTAQDPSQIPALRCQATARLALALGRHDLQAALPYFRASTPR